MSLEKDSFKFLRMAALDPLCCHFALAKDLAEKKMPCGVGARDKLLMDAIEAKQEEIFQKKDGRLAETDKEKKALKSVLKMVRTEVENLNQNLHGFLQLEIIKKSSGIIGGVFRLEDTMFTFLVDKKKKALTVEKLESGGPNEGNIKNQYPIFCTLMDGLARSGKNFCFTFPLRCAACRGGGKEDRLEH